LSTTITETTDWTIEKTVNMDQWDLFSGDTGTSQYTITVDKTVVVTAWAVSGSFTIENMDNETLEITEIEVDIGGTMALVDFMDPIDLGAGEMIIIEYSANCFSIGIEKSANTNLTRTWNWSIDKAAKALNGEEISEIILPLNQEGTFIWEVTTDATSSDSEWSVTGEIKIINPAPIDALINDISDVI
jgi:hypothetical protein